MDRRNEAARPRGRRWYDRHEGLSQALEKLKNKNRKDRDTIVDGLKRIITKKDARFIDKIVEEFPLDPYKRRWYDKDPYLWLVINSLRYVDERTIDEVVEFIERR